MKNSIISALALAVLAYGCAPDADQARAQSPAVAIETGAIVGVASVVDGDTLEIRGDRIRLYGVDAFESGQRCRDSAGARQRCGRMAAFALDELVRQHSVRCVETDRDRWGRIIARCATTRTPDLSAALVEQGWALAFTRYSQRYVPQEAAARAQRRGAWAGSFDAPADWRAGRRTDVSS
jgi:endonuclease YncB( thermonuclease family)